MDNLYSINDEVWYNDRAWLINSIQTYTEKSNELYQHPDPTEEPAIRVEYHLISLEPTCYKNGKPAYEEDWDIPEEYIDDLEEVEKATEEAKEEKRLHDRDVSRTIYENTKGV